MSTINTIDARDVQVTAWVDAYAPDADHRRKVDVGIDDLGGQMLIATFAVDITETDGSPYDEGRVILEFEDPYQLYSIKLGDQTYVYDGGYQRLILQEED